MAKLLTNLHVSIWVYYSEQAVLLHYWFLLNIHRQTFTKSMRMYPSSVCGLIKFVFVSIEMYVMGEANLCDTNICDTLVTFKKKKHNKSS